MNRIIKMAALDGITVNEARTRYPSTYSSTVRRTETPPLQSSSNIITPPHLNSSFSHHQEVAVLQNQIQVLQEQVKAITFTAIPQIQGEIKSLAGDLSNTNRKINDFNKRFDMLDKKHSDNASLQESRFDRLELILNNLIGRRAPSVKSDIIPDPLGASINPTMLHQHITADLSPMFNSTRQWCDGMDTIDNDQ